VPRRDVVPTSSELGQVSRWLATGIDEQAEADEIHSASLDGTDVALVRTGGHWYAFEGWCSHAECAFSDYGELDGTIIICNCHGAEFDIRTGEVLQEPADAPIKVLPVRCRDRQVEVEIVTAGGERARHE
jgi:nitrite reductase/ring-hydroxylating ferredoxin subunit